MKRSGWRNVGKEKHRFFRKDLICLSVLLTSRSRTARLNPGIVFGTCI